MRTVTVSITEIYRFDLTIEVDDTQGIPADEAIADAISEVPLLIDRDKEWLEANRDTIKVEYEYEHPEGYDD